jgi:hypothetical protein
VCFLRTSLQQADRDDYKKLAQVMKYLQLNVNLPLTLSCDGSGVLTWWVDASYAVYPDMKVFWPTTLISTRGHAKYDILVPVPVSAEPFCGSGQPHCYLVKLLNEAPYLHSLVKRMDASGDISLFGNTNGI